MRTRELSRVEFLSWLADLEGPNSASDVNPSKLPRGSGSVTLVWPNNSRNDDPLISVKAQDLREFLAFVSTYVGTYTPFTAFFRVVPLEMLEFLPDFSLSDQTSKYVQSFVGIAIAEASLHSPNSLKMVTDISVQSCLATSTATVFSSAMAGYEPPMSLLALQRWFAAKSVVGGAVSKVDVNTLEGLWSNLLPVLQGDMRLTSPVSDLIREALRGSSNGGDLPQGLFARFAPPATDLGRMLRSSREDRVRALDDLHNMIGQANLNQQEAEILLGFAASQVAEGSLAYLPLVSRFEKQYPLAILWFGAFAALNKKSDVLTSGNCLGRRVLRHFTNSAGGLPEIRADLNYEECLLYEREVQSRKIRTDHGGFVEVELLPGVSGLFGRQRVESGAESVDSQSVKPDNLNRARRLARDLVVLLGGEAGSAQPSLFGTDESEATTGKRGSGVGKRKGK